ncbi:MULTISPECIES: cell division protein FtsK [Nocardiopsidaceae]|uniref:Cell division protein FtsK n=1 Tax=Streptomonospora nanhaiensis TaxID=1323731 RepID=A0ABY6YKR4_9ACTN|nr:cell division protein FtsK [Streptomonospora nanhaiensis]WAE72942.1 cell division protein FtsK [Streptomonospora nanhaiensis]
MSYPTPHQDDRTAEETGQVLNFPTVIGTAAPRPRTEDPAPAPTEVEVEYVEPTDVEVLDEDTDTGPARRVDTQVEQWADQSQWLARVAEGSRTTQPIVPLWLRDRTEAEQVLRWVTSYYAHVAAYQATRTPLYMLRLMGRSPRGAARILGTWGRWAFDTETTALRRAAAGGNRTGEYMMLSRQHSSRVKVRVTSSLVLATATLITVAVVSPAAPAWALWSAVWAGLSMLGLLGRRPDQPLIDRAVLPTKVEKLTSDAVLKALSALGISEITRALAAKGDEEIGFTAPITRDGPGWRAEVNLPRGVVVTDVIDKRDKLASGLRRPLGCVWPEPVNEEHPGKLVLWVGDQAMNQARPTPWPLTEKGTTDLFKPLPFGSDQRARAIAMTLMFESVLIGAKPRMGKTFALRVLLLAAALDPNAELNVFELKGTGDCQSVEKVSHVYASGADQDTMSTCMNTLRRIANKELVKRAETISRIAKADPKRCPENKVTPELSADRSLGLHPIVLAVDECQELFTNEEYKQEAAKLAEAIIKRGPAMGIILLLATQRPDSKSLPTGVSANVGIRFCLRVMGQLENDMVLGTSSYKNGIRATTFTAKDKGIGYLVGVEDDAVIARSAYIDGPAAETISERARAARIAAGTLTGHAAGEEIATEDTTTILDHLLAVWPGDVDAVWSVRLIDALADYRPGLYAAWLDIEDEKARATQLTNALKPHKVGTRQLNREGSNKRGVDREAVEQAANR